MDLKPIKSEKEYSGMLKWVDQQFNMPPVKESFEGERLKRALNLIKDFEDKNYPIPTDSSSK